MVEQVRGMPKSPTPEASEAILESLALDPAQDEEGVLSRLASSAVDGLTLLGNHTALVQAVREAAREATPERGFAVVLLQLQELARINDEAGYVAGDRLIQVAARRADRAATRLGGSAYRASGRRLAILVPVREGDDIGDVLQDIRSEFLAGPSVHTVASPWKPGDRGEAVLARARSALRGAEV
jgi:diguanylate cyclase (GGDEF)-like protein